MGRRSGHHDSTRHGGETVVWEGLEYDAVALRAGGERVRDHLIVEFRVVEIPELPIERARLGVGLNDRRPFLPIALVTIVVPRKRGGL